jgi:hypothetical protein
MAKAKEKTKKPTERVKKPTTESGGPIVKPYTFRAAESKHLGDEPLWEKQPDESVRTSAMAKAFTWYNYFFDSKEAKNMLIQWLEVNKREKEAKIIKGVSDKDYSLSHCWLARMNLMGLQITESEKAKVNLHVTHLKDAKQEEKQTAAEAALESETKKATIQDRLRDKIQDCASELDGLYDEFIQGGAKMTANIKPISIIRGMNVAPQLISTITDIWKKELSEFEAALVDKEVAEYYDGYTKTQLKAMVKFAETVIADCASYVQVKKAEKKPRAKKAVSPEKLAIKFKFLREFPELKLKSEPAAKLVASQEAWLYDSAKRKLIYVVADLNAGSLTVKGSSIVGFDEKQTVQKTLRKPAEQIKEVLKGGKPAARKAFKDIKTTETKWTGRSNENLVILKVW